MLEVMDFAETFGASSILNKGTLKIPADNPPLKVRYDLSGGNFAEQ